MRRPLLILESLGVPQSGRAGSQGMNLGSVKSEPPRPVQPSSGNDFSADMVVPAMPLAGHRLVLAFALMLLVGSDHATKHLANGALEGGRACSLVHGIPDLQ